MSMSNSAILEKIRQLKQWKQDLIAKHSGPEDNDDSFLYTLEDIDYEIECWENVLEFGVANPYA